MKKVFEHSWVSVIDEILQEWISKYTCPAWIFVRSKTHPFGNESNTIACRLSTITFFAEIVEGRDRPCERRRIQFDDIGKTMLQCTRPIWNFAKLFIVDSEFCVTKGLVELQKKGLFGATLIKKCIYWPENIKGGAINARFSSKEVGNVDPVKQLEDGVAHHVFWMKYLDYVMKLMTKY